MGSFRFPIVYSDVVEAPYVGTLQDFTDAVEAWTPSFNMDVNGEFLWNDLVRVLVATEQFRAMFEYACPLNTILSLLGIYNAEGFLNAIGGADDWHVRGGPAGGGPILNIPRPYRKWNHRAFPILKRKLKRQFNIIYTSNDFTYIHESPARASREEGDRWRFEFDMSPIFDRLTWPVKARITYANPMCYSEETGTEAGIGPGEAPGAGWGEGEAPGPEEPGAGLVCATYTVRGGRANAIRAGASVVTRPEIMLPATAWYMSADSDVEDVSWRMAPDATLEDLFPGVNTYGESGLLSWQSSDAAAWHASRRCTGVGDVLTRPPSAGLSVFVCCRYSYLSPGTGAGSTPTTYPVGTLEGTGQIMYRWQAEEFSATEGFSDVTWTDAPDATEGDLGTTCVRIFA